MAQIGVLKLDSEARIPQSSTSLSAGLDVFSLTPIEIKKNNRLLIHTGISLLFDRDYCVLILPRSGLALNFGLQIHIGIFSPFSPKVI